MYVCMYVCMYVSMYLCIYVCMYVSMYVCIYVCMYVCIYVSMYVSMYVCMYVCMYICMYVCMYIFMYVCMYVCMYACMYVCMFIKLHIIAQSDPVILVICCNSTRGQSAHPKTSLGIFPPSRVILKEIILCRHKIVNPPEGLKPCRGKTYKIPLTFVSIYTLAGVNLVENSGGKT